MRTDTSILKNSNRLIRLKVIKAMKKILQKHNNKSVRAEKTHIIAHLILNNLTTRNFFLRIGRFQKIQKKIEILQIKKKNLKKDKIRLILIL